MKKYLKPENFFLLYSMYGKIGIVGKYIYLFLNCVCCLNWCVVLIMTFTCVPVYEFGRDFSKYRSRLLVLFLIFLFFLFLFSCVFRCFFLFFSFPSFFLLLVFSDFRPS